MSKLIEFQTVGWNDNKPDYYTVWGSKIKILGYPYITAYKGYYTLNKSTKKWYIVDANAHFLIGRGAHKIEDALKGAIEYLKYCNCTELLYWKAVQSSLMLVLKSVK